MKKKRQVEKINRKIEIERILEDNCEDIKSPPN
jgi:hypothetical protein